jgi:hypothetical protein
MFPKYPLNDYTFFPIVDIFGKFIPEDQGQEHSHSTEESSEVDGEKHKQFHITCLS